jgi:hypothetical protein
MGIERLASNIGITLGAMAVGAVCYLNTCNDSTKQRARDESTPAGIAGQETMNPGRRYEPLFYVGPTISDASKREYFEPLPAPQTEKHDGIFYSR